MRAPYDGTGPRFTPPAGLVPKKAKAKPKAEPVEEIVETDEVETSEVIEDTDEGYDPAEHSVGDVMHYLDENPDQTEYVMDREQAGKARSTLLSQKES
jgi:hypothetical protein